MRCGTTAAFNLVPPSNVSPAPSGSGNTWPETTSGGSFTAHLWDMQATLGTGDELVQVQACYGVSASDANPVCAAPNDIQCTSATFADNNATIDLGPGSLSLSTGDLQVSAADAAAATSLGGLSVGRSLTTLAPAAANSTAGGVFGPGWSADLVGADAGDADLSVNDQAPQGYLEFTDTRDPFADITTQQASVAGATRSSQNYTYDPDDRLTGVQDTYNGACTTRAYTFDADSNRTKLDSYAPASGGGCTTSSTDTALSYSYDKADRLTSDTAGTYSYDTLGRTTTVPAADAIGIGANANTTGNATIGYDANDMVSTQTQGSKTLTFTLDPAQDRINTTSDGTTTNHYSDDDDSPVWTSTTASAWTRNIIGPDGNLAATASQSGAVTLQLPNLEGNIAATCANDTSATTIASYTEDTEYGAPRSAAAAPTNYGWLGTKARSSADLGGFTLMSVRLYDSATGRFLSNDPVYGGNANAYVYPDDPISLSDTTGMYCWCHTFHFHIDGDTLNSEDDAAQIADTWLPRLADGISEVPGLGGHNWVVPSACHRDSH